MSAHAGRCTIATASRALTLVLAAVVSSTSSIAQGTAYFAPTGSMSTARQSAATALLDDGRALIVGHDGGWPAELYDPASGQFVPTGAPSEARSDVAAVRLSDARVLVVGGRNAAGALAIAELYDPVSGAFTPAGSMLVARARPAVARLPDGRVLIAGGHDGDATRASAELYDPGTGEFVTTGSMASARAGTATLLTDGNVLVVGGAPPRFYDPVRGEFRAAGDLNVPRRGHAATLLADGRVLVTGGVDDKQNPVGDAEVFDSSSGEFRLAGRMLEARSDHAAVPLPDGAVLALGGRDATGVLGSTEIYDPAHGTFTAEAPLIEPRSAPLAIALLDGGVLVAGGRGTHSEALATAERYRRDDRQQTSTYLASSMSVSMYGQPVSYLARVRSGDDDPSGVVQFFDGETVLCEAPLDDDGRAVLTTPNTPAGNRLIKAAYTGSAEFKRSESAPIQQTVARASATGSLTLTPIQRQYSDRVIFTATVFPATAAQSVTFRMGTIVLGSAPVVAGTALLDIALSTNTPPGSRIITAVFNQDVPNQQSGKVPL